MPFFRNSPQAQPYEHTSIDLDDFEVIIGRKDGQDLEVEQLEFINGIVERAHRTKTAFSTHFSPLNLTERHVASEDPAFKAMCSRGIELLGVDPDADDGAIALAARRAADSAEAFLRTPAAGDTRLGRYAREVRLRARETLAERILRTPQPMGGRVRITSRSDEFALTTRERARLMAECFGVHRGPDVPGVDFILDARGKVAYAFKPMTEAAPRAVCRSRLHVSMSRAISKGSIEAEIASHPVPAVIVSMPGRWGTVATSAHPERDIEEAEETLGLLMIAPPGFDLCLASADDEREHGTEAGGRRLSEALARPLTNETFELLALTAMCAGDTRLGLDGVLVDEGGRAWMLDHDGSFAARQAAAGLTAQERLPQERLPQDMPMRPDRLRALARLESPTKDTGTFGQPTDRERRLLAEALGKTGDDLAALDALWPSPAELAGLQRRLVEVGAWAAHVNRMAAQLLAEDDPTEVMDLQHLLTEHGSVRWLLAADEREDARSRPVA